MLFSHDVHGRGLEGRTAWNYGGGGAGEWRRCYSLCLGTWVFFIFF
jgi:hypothetical protein